MNRLWLVLSLLLMCAVSGCGYLRVNQNKKHFLHKGNLAYKEKMFQDAIRFYKEAIRLDSSFAQAYSNLGVVYAATGKNVKALACYNRSLKADPAYADAYFNRGNLYIQERKFKAGLADMNNILHDYQPDEKVWFAKGLCFFGLKNYDSAAYAFHHAQSKDTTNIEIYINLASTAYRQKEFDKAEKFIEKALSINSKNTDAANVSGLILLQKGDTVGALASYNRGLSLESNNAYLLNNRGYIHLLQGDLTEALTDFNESLSINPENPWVYRNKGIYMYKVKKYDRAKALVQRALDMDSTLELGQYYSGEILLKEGLKAQACEAFSRSSALGEAAGESAYRANCR